MNLRFRWLLGCDGFGVSCDCLRHCVRADVNLSTRRDKARVSVPNTESSAGHLAGTIFFEIAALFLFLLFVEVEGIFKSVGLVGTMLF